MQELHVQLPEMELLLDIYRESNSLQIQCKDVLEGPLEYKVCRLLLAII